MWDYAFGIVVLVIALTFAVAVIKPLIPYLIIGVIVFFGGRAAYRRSQRF